LKSNPSRPAVPATAAGIACGDSAALFWLVRADDNTTAR